MRWWFHRLFAFSKRNFKALSCAEGDPLNQILFTIRHLTLIDDLPGGWADQYRWVEVLYLFVIVPLLTIKLVMNLIGKDNLIFVTASGCLPSTCFSFSLFILREKMLEC